MVALIKKIKNVYNKISFSLLAAALLEEESPRAVESFALERHRRSTNETSSDSDSAVSTATATFVLNLVVNVAYVVYDLVISDFAAAANSVLVIINLVLQYVLSSL